MKKIKALILLVVFCCITFALGACDNSAEHDNISTDYAKKYNIEKENVEFKCYGEFGGTHVLLFNGMYAQALSSETVDGVTFEHSCIINFYAYNNGSFYCLQEAFDKGLLTHANLVAVRNKHKADFPNLYVK